MKLSTKGRYGLNALYHLAQNDGKLMSLKELSECTLVPQPYLEKLLGLLKKGGLVTSVRGVQGGYKLALDPKDISIGVALRSLENGLVFTDCAKSGTCANLNCPNQGIFKVIYDNLNDVLDSITLLDMIQKNKGAKK